MEQSINLFLDNNNLTSQNSLTHLLDFDTDFNDLTNSIKPSMYYTEGDFINKLDNKSDCIIMSLNPIRSGGGGFKSPPPSDFLLSRI